MWPKAPNLTASLKSKMKSNAKVRPATAAMLELATLMFLKSLAEEARTKAFEGKSASIRCDHVKDVSKILLKKARG
ncbi:centromere protein W [Synchiropus picturatus]